MVGDEAAVNCSCSDLGYIWTDLPVQMLIITEKLVV